MTRLAGLALGVALLGSTAPSHAAPAADDGWTFGGRLLATGGATQLEGTSGGGIVPWATLAGHGTADEVGAAAFHTWVEPQDYALASRGVAVTLFNRVELSFAQQSLDLGTLGRALGTPGAKLRQDIVGAKVRVAGDLVYGDHGQLAVGVQYKHHRDFALPRAVGARKPDGVDVYVAASKLWLDGIAGRSVLANLTIRSTRANQTGLLGFGGDRGNRRRLMAEASVGLFLDRNLVVGAEWRQKPDNLGFATEDDWHDVFVGWFPNKHVAVVGAYARLGSIAGIDRQNAWYLSVQAGF